MKTTFILSVLTLFTFFRVSAQRSEIFVADGNAIKGYDPVAFFVDAKPVKGQDSLSFKWKDATWLFSNRENMESFKAAPEKYAPQYGGYCAYGTSEGHKAPTETDTWTILNNKLYFNYNKKVQQIWKKDTEGRIKKADQQWPAIKDQP